MLGEILAFPVLGADVGWAERSESHQKRAKTELVGLVSLGPPYNCSHSAPRTGRAEILRRYSQTGV